MDRLELDTLVTVLDAGSFVSDYASRTPLASRPELGEGGDMRPVVDLLVEQVRERGEGEGGRERGGLKPSSVRERDGRKGWV